MLTWDDTLTAIGLLGFVAIAARFLTFMREGGLVAPDPSEQPCKVCNGWGKRYRSLFARRKTSKCPACRAGAPSAETLRIRSLEERNHKQAAELDDYKRVVVPKMHAELTAAEERTKYADDLARYGPEGAASQARYRARRDELALERAQQAAQFDADVERAFAQAVHRPSFDELFEHLWKNNPL